MAYTMIDNTQALLDLLVILKDLPTEPPFLYIDLEGSKLSRHGSMYLIQIFVLGLDKTFFVDICSLGASAFSTQGYGGTTLRSIFEDPMVPKVLFDLRNDADALYALYDVSLKGAHDLQIMEVATRPAYRRNHVNGLARCIQDDAGLSYHENSQWQSIKNRVTVQFSLEKGGTYEVFRQRPLNDEVAAYCVQDVKFLPRLYNVYRKRLSEAQFKQAVELSEKRSALSRLPEYISHGQHKAYSPWSPLSKEYQARLASS